MLVIHALWDSRNLHLWAESSNILDSLDLNQRASGKLTAKGKPHPYTLPSYALKEILGIVLRLPTGSIDKKIIGMPGKNGLPLPSPWIPSGSYSFKTGISGQITVSIDTLKVEPKDALDFLLDLPTNPPTGMEYADSLRFWSKASHFTMELIAGGNFVPTLVNGFARWKPIIEGQTEERLVDLISAMPKGFIDLPPDKMLISFIQEIMDAFLRDSLKDAKLITRDNKNGPEACTVEENIIEGLSSKSGEIAAPREDVSNFFEELGDWLENGELALANVEFKTCIRLELPDSDDDKWPLKILLQGAHDPSLQIPADDIWTKNPVSLGLSNKKAQKVRDSLLKDLLTASSVFLPLAEGLRRIQSEGIALTRDQACDLILKSQKIVDMGLVLIVPSFAKKPVQKVGAKLHINAPTGYGEGLFKASSLVEYEWQLALGEQVLSAAEFYGLASRKIPLVRVRGEWTMLRPKDIESTVNFLKKAKLSGKMSLLQSLSIDLAGTKDEDADEDLSLDGSNIRFLGVDATKELRRSLDSMAPGEGRIARLTQPDGFNGTLRPYQITGLSWMDHMTHLGMGVCLADDMGLGKTVQLLALLLHQRNNGHNNSNGNGDHNGHDHLPGSQTVDETNIEDRDSLKNVENESNSDPKGDVDGISDPKPMANADNIVKTMNSDNNSSNDDSINENVKKPSRLKGRSLKENISKRENPSLLICPMSVAGNWEREANRFAPSLKVMVHHGTNRVSEDEFKEHALDHDLVITTYALAHRDEKALSSVYWENIVLDEAQNIKNPITKQTKSIKSLKAQNRIALTGTPVENRLSELWSIMDFLNSRYLGPKQTFQHDFALQIEKNKDQTRAGTLKRMVQPFILRRLKTDRTIIQDLPDKLESKVYYHLTTEQASLYGAVVADMMEKIEQSNGIARKGLVLSALVKLKQICDHPTLFLQDKSHLDGRSGKLQRMVEMLEEVLESGEKALIFTQFSSMGSLLGPYLEEKLDTDVLYLHGRSSKKQREKMIYQFQNDSTPLFILSLKAGGYGLNLTAANHVFHFDRWWNPAVENQATDRVFRIGQPKNVFAHKFVCLGTLEERIDQLLESKKELANSIINSGESWVTEMSNDQLREILRLNANSVDNLNE